jgi:hypothetical protein
VTQAVLFKTIHHKPIILCQNLWNDQERRSSCLSDPAVLAETLAVAPVGGEGIETCIDCEPYSAELIRLKSASIGLDAYQRIADVINEMEPFDYALPELCGQPRSMYRTFPHLGWTQITEQTYRKGAKVSYPIGPDDVIGLALTSEPDKPEYLPSEALEAWEGRDKFFFPAGDPMAIARLL